MKRKIYIELLILAILGLVSCVFAGCKKSTDKPKDVRQFDVEGFGAYTCYYINGAKTDYTTSTGYQPIKIGNILKVVSDTSSTFVTCKIDLKIFNGNNELIDEKITETPTNQTVIYTVK